MPRSPTIDLDKVIGTRIRTRRAFIGKSQTWLGEQIGVTFQQVQKYERGVNRVSGGRLLKVASALDVSPAFLLGASEVVSAGDDEMIVREFVSSREGMAIAKAFAKLPATLRRSLAQTIVTAAR